MQGIRYDDVKFPKVQSSGKHSTYWYVLVCTSMYWYILRLVQKHTSIESHSIRFPKLTSLHCALDLFLVPSVFLQVSLWNMASSQCEPRNPVFAYHTLVHISTYQYVLICIHIGITLFIMYRYILVHTSTYLILTVQRIQSQGSVVDPVQGSTYHHTPYQEKP